MGFKDGLIQISLLSIQAIEIELDAKVVLELNSNSNPINRPFKALVPCHRQVIRRILYTKLYHCFMKANDPLTNGSAINAHLRSKSLVRLRIIILTPKSIVFKEHGNSIFR